LVINQIFIFVIAGKLIDGYKWSCYYACAGDRL